MTRMTIEAHGTGRRHESIHVENERERSAADAIAIAVKKYPDADRIVITGRNGMLLYEEHLRRADGVWVDQHPRPAPDRFSLHMLIHHLMRRLFP